MKKIFLLVAMLSTSIVYGKNTDVMNVQARVLQPLSVRVDKNVDFGKVVKGSMKNVATGTFSVQGEPSETINIKLEGLNQNKELRIVNAHGDSLVPVLKGETERTHTFITENFEQAESVQMTLNVPNNVKSGVYKGQMTIVARYN